MKIKEAIEIYNKHLAMKDFEEFIDKVKEMTDECDWTFETRFRWRFGSILDELKDLADVAIKEYEEILDGEYKKD
mgnify:FL=1